MLKNEITDNEYANLLGNINVIANGMKDILINSGKFYIISKDKTDINEIFELMMDEISNERKYIKDLIFRRIVD